MDHLRSHFVKLLDIALAKVHKLRDRIAGQDPPDLADTIVQREETRICKITPNFIHLKFWNGDEYTFPSILFQNCKEVVIGSFITWSIMERDNGERYHLVENT